MKCEADMRSWVAEGLASSGLASERFEPGLPAGMSDVLWFGGTGLHRMGWLELKWEVDVVRISQRDFLRRIVDGGGAAHVLAIRDGIVDLVRGDRISLECRIDWKRSSYSKRWDLIDWESVSWCLGSGS